jgi:DNA-binding CsgD family transcriptional regulator
MLDMFTAFSGAPDLGEAFQRAYPSLKKLVPADHGALCLSRAEELGRYDWASAELPETFFRPYDEMAGEDFVLAAVARAPNKAFRDQEMGLRSDLEKSSWYRYCRDLKIPIEHVMASMLSVEQGWHGGLVLYSDRKRPFSDRDRAIFQDLVEPFGIMLGNCKRIWDAEQKATALETVMGMAGLETIVFSPAGREVARTPGASMLIEQWYPSVGPGRGRVPERLLEWIREVAQKASPIPSAEEEVLESAHGSLRVRIMPVPEQGRISWALVFELRDPEIPPQCRALLTPREIEVVKCVLQGSDNSEVAEDLDIEVGTVKKHLYRIFMKLGVYTRAELIARCRPNR